MEAGKEMNQRGNDLDGKVETGKMTEKAVFENLVDLSSKSDKRRFVRLVEQTPFAYLHIHVVS